MCQWPQDGLITGKIPSEDVTTDCSASSLKFNPTFSDAEMTAQEVVHVLIVHGHHGCKIINVMRNDNHQMFRWSIKPLPVYMTLSWDRCALYSMEIMNNIMLLITTSSIVPLWTTFMKIIHSVVAYAMQLTVGQPRVISWGLVCNEMQNCCQS